MSPRGRLRPSPTTTEDMEDTDTVSDTGATEDTAVLATSTVRFCLDVLDLDATTLCPWIGSRRISNLLEVQILKLSHLASSVKFLPHGSGEVQLLKYTFC